MLTANFMLFADAGVWYAFAHSDSCGKGIVTLLFFSSMYVWYIMLVKGLSLYRAQKLSERFANSFNNQHSINSVLRDGMDNPCPVARVYISGMEQLLEFYGTTAEEARTRTATAAQSGPRKLSPAQLDAVETAMEREISSQVFIIEERIGMLAMAVSLAPFLGLFGTVWGVMIAFCGVASAGSANIQALAPGVAGALLTTVAGLVVAIPSLIGYNSLTQLIRKITVSMDNFSEAFMAQLKLEQLNVKDDSAGSKPASAPAPAADLFSRPAAQIPVNVPQMQPQQPQTINRPAYQPAAGQYQQPQQPQTINRPAYQPAAGQYQQPQQPQQAQYQTPQQQYQQPQQQAQYQTPQQQYQPPQQMSFNSMNNNGSDPEDSMRV